MLLLSHTRVACGSENKLGRLALNKAQDLLLERKVELSRRSYVDTRSCVQRALKLGKRIQNDERRTTSREIRIIYARKRHHSNSLCHLVRLVRSTGARHHGFLIPTICWPSSLKFVRCG